MASVSSRSGIEFMTMLATTISECQTRAKGSSALFLEVRRSFPIHEEVEPVENKQNQVENMIFPSNSFMYLLFNHQPGYVVTDPSCESRLPLLSLDIYVPRDERFRHLKLSDFLAYAVKSIVQTLLPEIKSLCDKTINEFDCFQDVLDLYEGGMRLPNEILGNLRDLVPWQLFRELMRSDGHQFLKFPVPDVIKGMKF